MFTSSVNVYKILMVVVLFLWVLTNSTFFGHNSLPLVLIYVSIGH